MRRTAARGRGIATAALTVPIVILQSCAGTESSSGSEEAAVVRVMILPHLTYAPLLIAQEEGYFEAEGLDVHFAGLGSSSSTVPLLIQGKLDVLPGPASPALLNAIASGSPIRFVAGKGHLPAPRSCSHMGVVVRHELLQAGGPAEASGGVSPPPDIRRLSISREPLLRFLVSRAFELKGLSLDRMETLHIPSAAELDALRDGAIDAAFINEPWMSRLVEMGNGDVWIELEDVIPEMQYSVIAYGPRLLVEEPEVGRRFMVAYLRGIRQLNRGKTERNLDILEAATGLDRAELRDICWPAFRDSGEVDVGGLVEYQRWILDRGLIDRPVAEHELWDPSFTEYANQVLEE